MESKDINILIGRRLREVREIFNEGGKISTTQFAYLLSETRDRISNYENGRSAVPIKLLYELYLRGINPNYIITGEGEVFADNDAGKIFISKVQSKLALPNASKVMKLTATKTEFLKVAAGLIPPPPKK